ncbi:MAG: extracellular solute-binding protein [Myxococcales bacterium]|nr:extracellular solute-binding protein [Myxococcales bacterium]
MIRRRTAARLALAGLALAPLLLGAGEARADEGDEAATIQLWHAYRGAEEEALQAILEAHRAAGGPPVETLAIPYDAFGSKLGAAIPLGEGPDLYIDSHERLGDYRVRGIVAPVGDAFEGEAAFRSNAVQAVTLDDAIWGLPLSQKCVALYVNQGLLKEVPATLEGFAGLRDTLPEGVFPLAYEAQGAYVHSALLGAFGGSLLGPDDSFGFVGDPAVRSLNLARALIDGGVVPSDADGALVTNLFRGGKAATAISGPWLAADLEGSGIDYRVELLPKVEAADGAPMRPLLTVEAVMLSPEGAKRADVRALARRIAGPEAAALRQERARTLTARADVPLPPGDKLLAAFAAQAEVATPMPSAPAMRATWEPANRAIKAFLRGELDAEAATEGARKRFDDVRRPLPPPASPTPLLIVVGLLLLYGAFSLVRQVRSGELVPALRRSIPAYRYVAHAVITVGLLVILPLVVGAATSLWAGRPETGHYVGLANFVDILTARGGPLLATGSFYVVLLVTLLWTLANVFFHLAIGVSLGLVLSRPTMKLRGLYRVLLIIPWAVPNYVTALAWKGMFHRQFGAVTGLINALNQTFGLSIEPIAWFSHFSTAFTANLATNVWLGFPFMMVVTLGALTSVPGDVLEAAEVDGATRWQRMWQVTLPIIRPTLLPAVTLGAIWTFNMFNVVFLVSGGEPDGTTDILVSEAYRWAFTREAQYGYAAAYAVLIFLMLASVTRLGEWKAGRRAAREAAAARAAQAVEGGGH